MWKCSTCGEQVDDYLDACWNCRTGKDGSSPEAYFRQELVPRELQAMREKMSGQTDSDLLQIANLNPNDYRQDGIELARAELERRGVISQIYSSGLEPTERVERAQKVRLAADDEERLFTNAVTVVVGGVVVTAIRARDAPGVKRDS